MMTMRFLTREYKKNCKENEKNNHTLKRGKVAV